MKHLLIILLLFCFSLNSFEQSDTGFFDKTEAKNQLTHGLKDGKWLEYFGYKKGIVTQTDEKHASSYSLIIYKAGAIRWSKGFYMDGKLMSETVQLPGTNNFALRFYYENGNLLSEACNYHDSILAQKLTNYYENGKIKKLSILYTKNTESVVKNYDENGNEIK